MFHRFTELPTELKLEILRYCLVLNSPIQESSHRPNYTQELLLSIALVNKDFYKMATKIYYGENTFVIRTIRIEEWITAYWSEPRQQIMRHLGVSHPNFSMSKQVRKAVVQLNVNIHIDDFDAGEGAWGDSDWKYLLVMDEDDEANYHNEAQWQKHFQKLTYLCIVLVFDVERYTMLEEIARGAREFVASRYLRTYRTLLQADVVEVVIGEFTGGYWYSNTAQVQALRCAEEIVREVKSLVHVRCKGEAPFYAWKNYDERVPS